MMSCRTGPLRVGRSLRDGYTLSWLGRFGCPPVGRNFARFYFARRATPAQTKSAAIQRRLSTFSLRKNFAAAAVVMKVSEAVAGAMRLRSAPERAKRREKKLRAMQVIPRRNMQLERTALMAP